MPTDAPQTTVKIALAIVKHRLKKLVGDEAWELVGKEVVDAGGEQVTARLDAILGSREGATRLVEAGRKADACFQDRCHDPDLRGAISLSWGDLPSVQQALAELPTARDETALLDTLRQTLARDFPQLSPLQVEAGVELYAACLREQLLPLEKYTNEVIGRAVLRVEGKVDTLTQEQRVAFAQVLDLLRARHVIITVGGQSTVYGPVGSEVHGDITYNITNVQQPAAVRPNIPSCPLPTSATLFARGPIRDQLVARLTDDDGPSAIGLRGLPGVGKTDLLRAVGVDEHITAHFSGGVLYAELGPAPDLAQTLRTWLRELGTDPPADADAAALAAILRGALRDRQALLILDDLWETAMRTALALRDCGSPACRVLLSSRSADLAREAARGAEPLLLDVLPGAAALDLLREQASAVVQADEVGAAALVDALGRLPLAVKLAANLLVKDRRSSQPCRALLATWQQRLGQLRGHEVRPGAAGAQLSLEAVIAMSYDALPDDAARQAAGALAVFGPTPRSWDWEAMAAVWSTDEDTTVALEGALVGSGLVDFDTPARRYSLHQTIHAFLAQHIPPDVHERHARYYVTVASRADEGYIQGGERTSPALALFDQERAHIDGGWEWARAQPPAEAPDTVLLAYADATVYVGDLRYAMRTQRIPQLEAALAAARRLGRRDAEGRFLGNLGLAYADLGEARRAIEFYEQHRAIAREIGDRRGEGNALGNLGLAYADLGEARRAIDFYEQATRIFEEIGDRRAAGSILGNLGLAYADLGDARRAIDCYEQHLAIAREIGDRQGEASTSWNLGLLLEQQGDLERAAELMQLCVDFEREIGHPDAEQDAARLEQVRQRHRDAEGDPDEPP